MLILRSLTHPNLPLGPSQPCCATRRSAMPIVELWKASWGAGYRPRADLKAHSPPGFLPPSVVSRGPAIVAIARSCPCRPPRMASHAIICVRTFSLAGRILPLGQDRHRPRTTCKNGNILPIGLHREFPHRNAIGLKISAMPLQQLRVVFSRRATALVGPTSDG